MGIAPLRESKEVPSFSTSAREGFNGGHCDRNINHFFAGAIRQHRYHELHLTDLGRRARMNQYLSRMIEL